MKMEQGLEIQMVVYVNLYISKDNWSSKTWAAFTVSAQKSDWHILRSKYLWAILVRANIINQPVLPGIEETIASAERMLAID